MTYSTKNYVYASTEKLFDELHMIDTNLVFLNSKCTKGRQCYNTPKKVGENVSEYRCEDRKHSPNTK